MTAPLVSVVLPVYNGERHLAAAMASVLAQDVDLEVLVHDDGSTDGTAALLADIAAADPRVTITTAANQGPAASRNERLGDVRGAYVAFMDHDDLWPAGRLRRHITVLADVPSAPGVLGMTEMFGDPDAAGRVPDGDSPMLVGFLQAALFRRAAVAATGLFDTTLRAADDVDFLLRLIEEHGGLVVDDHVALHYRIHAGQWTADLQATGQATAKALAKSLRRRRAAERGHLEWRHQGSQA